MWLKSLLLTPSLFQLTISASIISTFVDTNCQTSLNSLTGPNGYPNGTCTDLRRNGAYGSFQIVSLDPGCEVTIYGNDTTNDPCTASLEDTALGQPIACYNATYHYYSIDMCDPAAAQSSAPPNVSAESHIEAIIGGVVGGILGLALIVGVVFWATRRYRFEQLVADAHHISIGEDNQLEGCHHNELDAGKALHRREAIEVEAPPVELGGYEVRNSIKSGPLPGLAI